MNRKEIEAMTPEERAEALKEVNKAIELLEFKEKLIKSAIASGIFAAIIAVIIHLLLY